MSYKRVQYSRLYEQVIEQIEKQISEGKLKLGDRLPSERELTTKMGVSRSTLREAFRILESQGIIETKPGGGRYLREVVNNEHINESESIIAELKKAAIIDLLDVREALELKMVELACYRIKDEEIEELENLLKEAMLDKNFRQDGPNYDFHISLAEYTKNIVILNFMKLNLNIIKQAREMSFKNKQNFLDAQREHFEILHAIKLRDVSLAKQKTIYHLENIRKRMTSIN